MYLYIYIFGDIIKLILKLMVIQMCRIANTILTNKRGDFRRFTLSDFNT